MLKKYSSDLYIKKYRFFFQRLMPIDAGSDLFVYKPPDIPTNKMYNIRPYTYQDESAVYNICRCTCYVGVDDSIKKSDLPDLIPDR